MSDQHLQPTTPQSKSETTVEIGYNFLPVRPFYSASKLETENVVSQIHSVGFLPSITYFCLTWGLNRLKMVETKRTLQWYRLSRDNSISGVSCKTNTATTRIKPLMAESCQPCICMKHMPNIEAGVCANSFRNVYIRKTHNKSQSKLNK